MDLHYLYQKHTGKPIAKNELARVLMSEVEGVSYDSARKMIDQPTPAETLQKQFAVLRHIAEKCDIGLKDIIKQWEE